MKIAVLTGLVALGVGQIQAQTKPPPPYQTGPFTVTAHVLVRGDGSGTAGTGGGTLYECFGANVPWTGACWGGAVPIPPSKCGYFRHTYQHEWCCIRCGWQNTPPYSTQYLTAFHYSYWIGNAKGQFFSIGSWYAIPEHSEGCFPYNSPSFWDSTSIAGAFPACKTTTTTPEQLNELEQIWQEDVSTSM
jgi:hypothetical protein